MNILQKLRLVAWHGWIKEWGWCQDIKSSSQSPWVSRVTIVKSACGLIWSLPREKLSSNGGFLLQMAWSVHSEQIHFISNYWEIWKIYATDVILEVTMDQCSTVLSLVHQSRKLNLIGAMCIRVAGYTEPKQMSNHIYTFPEPQPLQPQSNGGDHRTRSHNRKLVVPFARTNSYQFSFFCHTPWLWNELSSEIVQSTNVELFKERLSIYLNNTRLTL